MEIGNISELFGCDVFRKGIMNERLDDGCFAAWQDHTLRGVPLTQEVTDKIAEAMKLWAMEKGATHYCHWFQPMTGFTAEKHESFLKPSTDGGAITDFSGKELIRGEPDASSFPTGGLRSVAEARGCTVWDPEAFPFVKDGTLFIPAYFRSITGEALDKRIPLKRSMDAVSRAAVRILRCLGDQKTEQVRVFVGAEQEYFLIPKLMHAQREDLRLTGRSLFGAVPPKGQELGDHYLGVIRPRVAEFMQELDEALWHLGIPSKTRHCEGGPSQYELAPIYSDALSACDGNHLIMEMMKRAADKQDLVCLLHEKPFDGFSGSGKHINWSLITDTGRNLFQPGGGKAQNRRFLLFLAAFVAGVDEYQDFLRCSTANAGNDLRLGSHEAPSSVISVCLGDGLTSIVDEIIRNNHIKTDIKIESDRNRTAPLAFTGNKFEFRTPGASQDIADPIIGLNAIMADQLFKFAKVLESAEDKSFTVDQLICDSFTRHRRVLWNGNCYSDEWKLEAQRRGLSDRKDTPTALAKFMAKENVELVTRLGIYTRKEYAARFQVQLDSYSKCVKIEASTMIHMVMTQILPAVTAYGSELAKGVQRKKQAGAEPTAETELLKKITDGCNHLYDTCSNLEADLRSVPKENQVAAEYCGNVILPAMSKLRQAADDLERLTAKSDWPFPTYFDMLYY